MIKPILINLRPNKYSQELHYYPFAVKLDRFVESFNDLSNKVFVPNKTEGLNICVFNIITGIKKSKILTNYVSCESKCKFDGRKCKSNQSGIMINVGASVKNLKYVKKIILGILLHVAAKMVNI